jgi:3'(2'), 5'-bisphosphate nucleotidase
MVDPLDGTKEFIKRNGEFTVNIALICNGYPDMGVVYVPVSGELYFALKGLGAYRVEKIDPTLTPELEIEILVADGQKLPLRSKPEKYTVVSSRSHPSPETQAYIDKLKSIYGEVEVYPRGSSMKICMVAEGKASIYPRFGKTTEWDTAAGQAIAEIAGCRVLTVEGSKRMAYNKEDLENPWFIVDRLE